MSQQNLIPVDKMGWGERLAITSSMDLSDAETVKHVCEVLNVPVSELQAHVGLAASGDVIVNLDIEPTDYTNLFDMAKIKKVEQQIKKASSKKEPSGKRRGRQGKKIAEAFAAIPYTPTPIEAFRQQFNVSVPVLRQQKRFDPSQHLGRVRVKTDPETKQLMIYRDAPAAEA